MQERPPPGLPLCKFHKEHLEYILTSMTPSDNNSLGCKSCLKDIKGSMRLRSLEDVGMEIKRCRNVLSKSSVSLRVETIEQDLIKKVQVLCETLGQPVRRADVARSEQRYQQQLDQLELHLYTDTAIVGRLERIRNSINNMDRQNEQYNLLLDDVMMHIDLRINRCGEMLELITKKAHNMLSEGNPLKSNDELLLDSMDIEEKLAELRLSVVLTSHLKEVKEELMSIEGQRQQFVVRVQELRRQVQILNSTLNVRVEQHKRLFQQYQTAKDSHLKQIQTLRRAHQQRSQQLQATHDVILQTFLKEHQEEKERISKRLSEQTILVKKTQEQLIHQKQQTRLLLDGKSTLIKQVNQHKINEQKMEQQAKRLQESEDKLNLLNKSLREELNENNNQIGLYETRAKIQSNRIAEMDKKLREANQLLIAKEDKVKLLSKENAALSTKKQELKTILLCCQNQIGVHTEKLTKSQEERGKLQIWVGDISTQLRMSKVEILQRTNQSAVLEKINANNAEQLAKLNGSLRQYTQNLEDKGKQLILLESTVRRLECDNQKLKKDAQQADVANARLQLQKNEFNIIFEQQQKDYTAQSFLLNTQELQKKQAIQAIASLQGELKQFEQQSIVTSQQLQTQKNLRGQTEAQLTQFKKVLEQVRANEVANQSKIRELESWKKQYQPNYDDLKWQSIQLEQKYKNDVAYKHRLIEEAEAKQQKLQSERNQLESQLQYLRRLNTKLYDEYGHIKSQSEYMNVKREALHKDNERHDVQVVKPKQPGYKQQQQLELQQVNTHEHQRFTGDTQNAKEIATYSQTQESEVSKYETHQNAEDIPSNRKYLEPQPMWLPQPVPQQLPNKIESSREQYPEPLKQYEKPHFSVFTQSVCLSGSYMQTRLLEVLKQCNVQLLRINLLFQSVHSEDHPRIELQPNHLLLVIAKTDGELVGGVSTCEGIGPSFIFSISEKGCIRKKDIIGKAVLEKYQVHLAGIEFLVSSSNNAWIRLDCPGGQLMEEQNNIDREPRKVEVHAYELYELILRQL